MSVLPQTFFQARDKYYLPEKNTNKDTNFLKKVLNILFLAGWGRLGDKGQEPSFQAPIIGAAFTQKNMKIFFLTVEALPKNDTLEKNML